jgi:two-component system, LytTR family, sensor histidine kinase AlgZ
MHPILADRRRLALYLGVWLAIGLMLAGLLGLMLPVTPREALLFTLPVTLVYAGICLSAWWVCRAVPLGGAFWPTAGSLTGAALQSAAGWAAAGAVWSAVLRVNHAFPAERMVSFEAIAILFVAGIPLAVISLVVHYLILAFEASHEAERRAFESQMTAREAELRALRAQLNPHFLFNSLNSVNALIGSQPESARKMCENLGDFLRRTLALGARDSVSLDDELALVDRYLDIERVRFGERCRVTREIADDTRACRVPPLLLQPLVENAIKHGVAARLDGGEVRISARRDGGRLTLTVENDIDADAPARPGEGVGLENVRRRLRALAGRDARLDAEQMPERFRVTLTLPAHDSDSAAAAAAGTGGRS